MHKFPHGSNPIPPLSEFTVTAHQYHLTFKDLAVGQKFFEPSTRAWYRKTGEHHLVPDDEKDGSTNRFVVDDLDTRVEL